MDVALIGQAVVRQVVLVNVGVYTAVVCPSAANMGPQQTLVP